MSYNSRHWNWAFDFCVKHKGFKLPCKWCIATNDPDLLSDGMPLSRVASVVGQVPAIDPPGKQLGLKPDHYDEYQAWI